jgi:hypothetical protein
MGFQLMQILGLFKGKYFDAVVVFVTQVFTFIQISSGHTYCDLQRIFSNESIVFCYQNCSDLL